jgi:putative FmdB family regulatory protein
MRIAHNKEIDERIKMPLYDFECEPCAYYTEVRQRMSDPSTLECPVCGEETLRKVFINAPHTFIRGEAKTIGQLAEKNYKNMGFYEKQDRKIKDLLESSEVKDKRERHQKIVSMTPEQQTKWIREGD